MRRSYSRLARLPAFGLYDRASRLVATVRAASAADAATLFRDRLPRSDVERGERVRRVG